MAAAPCPLPPGGPPVCQTAARPAHNTASGDKVEGPGGPTTPTPKATTTRPAEAGTGATRATARGHLNWQRREAVSQEPSKEDLARKVGWPRVKV